MRMFRWPLVATKPNFARTLCSRHNVVARRSGCSARLLIYRRPTSSCAWIWRRNAQCHWLSQPVVDGGHLEGAALDAGPGILYRLHLDLASLSIAEFYPDGASSVRLVNETSYL